MMRVHPNASFPAPDLTNATARHSGDSAAADGDGGASSSTAQLFTVWRRSLVLSCTGFTVFDANGDLVFRVDHYGSASPSELVLMDAAGKPLLTLRRKKLGLAVADTWQIYDGESAVNPLYAVKKRHASSGQRSKAIARVTPCRGGGGGGGGDGAFEVEGSYGQRSCAVYDERRRTVAEVRRKEAGVSGVDFGGEVFRLVVHRVADLDARLAMAVVIALDQMFGSRS